MTGAVTFRHGPRSPRAQVVGYGPKTGHPRDETGALILVFEYVPPVPLPSGPGPDLPPVPFPAQPEPEVPPVPFPKPHRPRLEQRTLI